MCGHSLSHFLVFTPGKDGKYGTKDDGKVAIKSATYNPSKNSLRITLKTGVTSATGLQLRASGLLDASGNAVDGNRDGTPGGDMVTTFKNKTVVFG